MNEKTLCREFTVTRELLASTVGSGSVEVLATPMIVAKLEAVAAELAQGELKEGYTTVGSKISLEHLCPTAEGVACTALATLLESDGHVFRFEIKARDNAGLIALGTHERVAVNAERFRNKAADRREIRL